MDEVNTTSSAVEWHDDLPNYHWNIRGPILEQALSNVASDISVLGPKFCAIIRKLLKKSQPGDRKVIIILHNLRGLFAKPRLLPDLTVMDIECITHNEQALVHHAIGQTAAYDNKFNYVLVQRISEIELSSVLIADSRVQASQYAKPEYKVDIETTKYYECLGCGLTKVTKVCCRCHTARYCSAECIKMDWKNHRKVCVVHTHRKPMAEN
jgi:hypothetical protein